MSRSARFATGPLLIVLAAILWGADGLLRRSLYSLPPLTIVLFEHLIGLVLLLLFFAPRIFKERYTAKDWLALLTIGTISSVLGTLWFTKALLATNFIPFSVVFLLQKLQPIFGAIAAKGVLKEKITGRYAAFAALAILAAYFLTFPLGIPNLETGNGTLIAAGLAILAAAAWGSTTAVSRYLLLKHNPTAVTGMRFMIAAVFAALLVAILPAATFTPPTSPELLRLVVIALSTGMVALWIYYQGLKNTKAAVSAILELAFPLTAVLLDFFVYGTVLAPTQYLAGIVLLFAGYQTAKLNPHNG